MRIRKRHAVMLAIAALIVGVVTFQAVTANPPEPYVALVGDMPTPPVMSFECRERGEEWVVYTNSHNETMAQTTGNLCDYQPDDR